jgi:hypothetical protein
MRRYMLKMLNDDLLLGNQVFRTLVICDTPSNQGMKPWTHLKELGHFILFKNLFFGGHATECNFTSTKRHVFHFSQEKPIHRISTPIIVTASLCYSTLSNTIYNNNNNNNYYYYFHFFGKSRHPKNTLGNFFHCFKRLWGTSKKGKTTRMKKYKVCEVIKALQKKFIIQKLI